MKATILTLLLSLCISALADAQSVSEEFSVGKPVIDFVTTPEYSVNFGPKNKKVGKNKQWLEVEASFDWHPKLKEPLYLDELTINYYILLNNHRDAKKNTLLTGSVVHTSIPQSKGLKSVMYVSPRALERFFEGKVPATAAMSVFNIGITVTHNGAVVAENSWKGPESESRWWTSFTEVPGYVLNKNETPFAPLVWDYYEAIKTAPDRQKPPVDSAAN
jgi:hypothetical protein